MASPKVIVFGPTGAVGSAAARTAAELGAHVVLAMRDTNKPIPGLSAEQEKQGKFERVEADLTKPDTISNAVKTTGAKHAFVYLAHGSADHMKATVEALKSAGIELPVFLSSFTTRGVLKDIPPSDVIPWLHAQVELNLEEVFGSNGFVAVRPGAFASNTLSYKNAIHKGEVKIWGPDAKVDCIVPEDIGRVSGTILTKGPQGGEHAVYLYGPELLPQRETARTIAKALGLNPKIEAATEEEAYKMFVEERGFPRPLAKHFIEQTAKSSSAAFEVVGYPIKQEDMENVHKYTGTAATTFEEWVQQNKHLFVN